MTKKFSLCAVRTALVALCLHLTAPVALAAPPPSPPPTAPEDYAAVQTRLTTLQTYLADVKKPMNLWWGSWIGILGGLGVGQLTLAATRDPQTRLEEGERTRLYVSSGLSFAALALVLRPRPGRVGSRRLAAMPDDTPEARRQKLTAAETYLRDSAVMAQRIRGVWSHVLVGVVALGAGLGVGLAYDDLWLGLMAGGGPALIGEARIWTHPYRKQRYWEAYARDPLAPPPVSLAPIALQRGAGLSLHMRF